MTEEEKYLRIDVRDFLIDNDDLEPEDDSHIEIDFYKVRQSLELAAKCDDCGYCHIIIADGNIDDDHIASCLERTKKGELEQWNKDDYHFGGDLEESLLFLAHFKTLSQAERAAAYLMHIRK